MQNWSKAFALSVAVSASTSGAFVAHAAPKERPKMMMPAVSRGLVIQDLKKGKGNLARPGLRVTVNYRGVLKNGKQFDSSYGRGPFSFVLGSGQVIEGWDQGVAGMKVGGRRRLVIPGNLAYGEGGFPPLIGRNETLIFVIDLLGVKRV